MKAIVMAGGDGTRLRPVSSDLPKPMVPLFDRPVLEHILRLLRKNGIIDVCLTLRFLSAVVSDYFGDGSDFGINLEYRIEKEPLGTAGGVRSCLDFVGDEDFLVISGDAVCDFDLTRCISHHRSFGAEATIVLCRQENPLEYGLVVLSPDGHVSRFIEKPGWDGVITDFVNTGIYILSPSVLEDVPEGANRDFAKDIFPNMLKNRRSLFGFVSEGYWRDIGSPQSYLQSNFNALSGDLKVDFPAPEIETGVFSASLIPSDTEIIPPCYIGKNVAIGRGASIGPYASVLSGSRIGRGTRVASSMVNGALIGDRASVSGAIVCESAAIGSDAVLAEGCIIGSGSAIGDGALICENVRIWPNKTVAPGTRISSDLVSGSVCSSPAFDSGGVIRGEFGLDINPTVCFDIGAATAALSPVVGIGCCGGEAARVAADALGCAVCSAGSRAVRLDCSFPSEAAFAASVYALPATVFIAQSQSKAELYFFGPDGAPITRAQERKIEAGATASFSYAEIGTVSEASGIIEAYTATAVKSSAFPGQKKLPVKVSVSGNGASAQAARSVLLQIGATLSQREKGIPDFDISSDGFMMTATDETGTSIDSDQLMLILCLLEFENGSGRVAVPYRAPAAVELLASHYGAKVLRLGRDGPEAESLYASMLFLRHAPFAAARICQGMALRLESLRFLAMRLPRFARATREVLVASPRGAVMRAISEGLSEQSAEFASGIKISDKRGLVHIAPSASHSALLISTEAVNMEAAKELCADFERLARAADNAR